VTRGGMEMVKAEAMAQGARSSRPAGRLHGIDSPLRFEVTLVTPELAASLLDKCHPNQRSPKRHKIDAWAEVMAAGRWDLTHEALAIDEDGFLIDGRNRLLALCKARVSVAMAMCYGVPRAALVSVNCGTSRTPLDAARIAGMALPNAGYPSVARQMHSGLRIDRGAWSVQKTLDVVATYREGLDYVFSVMKKPQQGVTVASVRAVVARAFYTADRARLGAFVSQLYSGLPDDVRRDGASVLLRNWLLEDLIARERRSGRKSPRGLAYSYVEFALEAFLTGTRPAQLLTVSEEKFPLPQLLSYGPAAAGRG
jgi:hypothetical protein